MVALEQDPGMSTRGELLRAVFSDEGYTQPPRRIGCIDVSTGLHRFFIRRARNPRLDAILKTFDTAAHREDDEPEVHRILGVRHVKLDWAVTTDSDTVRSVVFVGGQTELSQRSGPAHRESAFSVIETPFGIFGEKHVQVIPDPSLDDISRFALAASSVMGQAPLTPGDLASFEDVRHSYRMSPEAIGKLATRQI